MFTDEIFGFKKLEDGRYEVKTFSILKSLRHGVKKSIYNCVLLKKYKMIIQILYVLMNAVMCFVMLFGGRHRDNFDKFSLIFILIIILFILITNLLIPYYANKSK